MAPTFGIPNTKDWMITCGIAVRKELYDNKERAEPCWLPPFFYVMAI